MKQNKPIIIGLTGTIGSGKSTCSKILQEQFNLPIIDADKLAYQICKKDGPGLKAIVDEFGPAYLLENGEYNRDLMSETVFTDKNALDRLNKCLHPIIKKEKERLIEEYSNEPIIIYDCPLLFESGEDNFVDQILVITTDELTRKDRLRKRNNFSDEELNNRIAAQISEEEKLNLADAVIYNNGTVEELAKALKYYLKDLKQTSERE